MAYDTFVRILSITLSLKRFSPYGTWAQQFLSELGDASSWGIRCKLQSRVPWRPLSPIWASVHEVITTWFTFVDLSSICRQTELPNPLRIAPLHRDPTSTEDGEKIREDNTCLWGIRHCSRSNSTIPVEITLMPHHFRHFLILYKVQKLKPPHQYSISDKRKYFIQAIVYHTQLRAFTTTA